MNQTDTQDQILDVLCGRITLTKELLDHAVDNYALTLDPDIQFSFYQDVMAAIVVAAYADMLDSELDSIGVTDYIIKVTDGLTSSLTKIREA